VRACKALVPRGEVRRREARVLCQLDATEWAVGELCVMQMSLT
jgi:hypothetical protein